MIIESDRIQIVELSRKYGATRTLLFGSAASQADLPSDIDLAVEGVAAASYYRFYGELMSALSKPVDLIDLGRKTLFTELVAREGVVLYG